MQQRSEETHQRLMQAALACFAAQGYDATGVAEICAAAGVSKGAFYHHFASKQAVFLALLDDWLGRLDAQMALHRQGAPSADAGLRAMAATFQQVFQDASGKLPMFLEFWSKATRDPAIWQATMAPFRRYEQLFSSLIADGIAAGDFRPFDVSTAARALIALAVGLLLQSVLDPTGAAWSQVVEESVALLVDGWKRI
jgi:AcrR family transcriptional regulator